MTKNPIVVIMVRREFTQKEVADMAPKLSTLLRRKEELEMEKKSITSDYASQIASVNAQITRLADKVSDGFEMIEVEAIIEKDYVKKEKVYLDPKANKRTVLKTEPFTQEDYQAEIQFENQEASIQSW